MGLLHVPLFHYCPIDRLPLVRLLYFGLRQFWSSGVDSRWIISCVCLPVEFELSRYTTSIGLSFSGCFFGEFLSQMLSTILSTRGVDRAWLAPGVAAEVYGEFMKLLASEYAVMRKVGPPGVSRMLKVFIVDGDCSCLGLVFSRDLFSDELE